MRITLTGVRDNMKPPTQEQLGHELMMTLAHYQPDGMDGVNIEFEDEF